MAFEITMVLAGPVADIALSGDLDASSAYQFEQKLNELSTTAAGPLTRLVLRMRDLVFLASVGIRMLLFAKQNLGSGLTVYVVAPQEQALDTIRRTGLLPSVIVVDEYPASSG
jgi:anti-anti-sigma factor